MKKYFNKLYKKDANTFYQELKKSLEKEEKHFIVTANPETFMMASKDKEFHKLLLDTNVTMVPDGIGIVKAAHKVKYDVKGRITGIDIAEKLLEYGNELEKTICVLGSKQEVIDAFANVLNKKYPNLNVGVLLNGYSKDKDKDFEKIIKVKPDIVLVALGMGNQEKLIYKHINKFDKGVFIGVGGSIDVLSGTKKRAPKILIKLNLEWLYRICKEPKRIKRFYENNIKFILRVKKLIK
ncbi:MAG: WecB/TagA/CpsF family glycosyltransferase [Bacilli bacterium]|nr:WecB/TagA/CpsF family glycosyltransferase [Bacilli bacterium]MDD4808774.1 WecB/TagA/CpsF family glycosyltransferase [Bacilli bacterium]